MSCIVHDVSSFPDGYDYRYGEISELDELDLKNVYALNIDECWYWYASGSHEGSGAILMRKGELFDIESMGHCSCYGPTENIKFDGLPIKDLLNKSSEEFKDQCSNLLKTANIGE